jgi:hypothetical protein
MGLEVQSAVIPRVFLIRQPPLSCCHLRENYARNFCPSSPRNTCFLVVYTIFNLFSQAAIMLSGKMTWTIDNGTLRLVLRVYFITMTTLLGLIGSECCKCAANVDLLSGKNVKLNRMTGWLRPIDIWTCVYKLRRLPGGVLLGFVMITTTLLSLTADLAVSKLVLPSTGPSDCIFTTGLVMDWTSNETFNSPPANGYPALIASNVQIYSAYSNCSVGIYNKVPITGDPMFCAKEKDILGGWNCQDQNADQKFDPSVSESDIEQTLFSASLQYSNMSYYNYYENDESHTTHLVICTCSLLSWFYLTSTFCLDGSGNVVHRYTYHPSLFLSHLKHADVLLRVK